MNIVLKTVQTIDNTLAHSTFVYQLLIFCSCEITFDIFRQKQQVATSCAMTSFAKREIEFSSI
jgi:hypothetical protein